MPGRDALDAVSDTDAIAAALTRDALELNDSIVQGLTVIKYALELGDLELAEQKVDETLAAARRVITDLLIHQRGRDEVTGHLIPGSMVRRSPASTHDRPRGGTR